METHVFLFNKITWWFPCTLKPEKKRSRAMVSKLQGALGSSSGLLETQVVSPSLAFLIQWIWSGTWEFALKSSQVMLLLLILGVYSEKRLPRGIRSYPWVGMLRSLWNWKWFDLQRIINSSQCDWRCPFFLLCHLLLLPAGSPSVWFPPHVSQFPSSLPVLPSPGVVIHLGSARVCLTWHCGVGGTSHLPHLGLPPREQAAGLSRGCHVPPRTATVQLMRTRSVSSGSAASHLMHLCPHLPPQHSQLYCFQEISLSPMDTF